jgi:hypothetical protein
MSTNTSGGVPPQHAEPPRNSRGGRTTLPVDGDYARLIAMVTALTAELSVVRERLDTYERLAERAGVFTKADVEQFEPDTAALSERANLRSHLLETVFRVIEQDLDRALEPRDAGRE